MWSPNRQQKAETQYYNNFDQSRAASAPQNKKRNSSYSSSSMRKKQKEVLPPLQQRMEDKRHQQQQQQQHLNSARYLRLKNEAVKQERKAREEEEAILQERVNDHLASLLQAHKQHKREMMTRWSSHAHAPVPKTPPLNPIARAREEEQRKLDQEKQDRRANARDATRRRLQRGTMLEPAPTGGNNNSRNTAVDSSLPLSDRNNMSAIQNQFKNLSQSMMSNSNNNNNNNNNNNASTGTGMLSSTSLQQQQDSAADARATANFAQIAQIYETVLQPQKTDKELEDTATEIPLNFVPNSISDMKDSDDFGPLLVSLTPEQRKRLRQIDKKHQKTRARLAAQEAMFEKAKQRRKVASDRIKEDPPADVLVQADLRRYIPADLLESIPELGAGPGESGGGGEGSAHNLLNFTNNNNTNNDKSTVFLTDVNVPDHNNNNNNNNNEDQAVTKKERKEKLQKEKDSTRNDKNEYRRKSLAMASATKMMSDANTSSKQKALQGGPLQNTANNRKMTIFAREVLMKVATTQAIRDEKERTKAQREKDERRRQFQEAGLDLPSSSSDDDEDGTDEGEEQHQQRGLKNGNDDDNQEQQEEDPEVVYQKEKKQRRREKKRLEKLHQHDYDHFFDHNLPSSSQNQQSTTTTTSNNNNNIDYLKMNSAQEQQAAIEWYNKYHAPLVNRSTKNKAMIGAKKNSSSTSGAVAMATQRQEQVVEQWKNNHKPVDGLPKPSRTLFFDSEGSKDDLRRSLY